MRAVAYLDLRRRQAVHARAIRRLLEAGIVAWSVPFSVDGAITVTRVVRVTGGEWEIENGEWRQAAMLG